ncbi:MAG: ABC transporter permease [Candidatus Aenigmarchaeota archaeon]|nr:ABC transporter permease [Candidatus Aenigmarchaeota archaeon]
MLDLAYKNIMRQRTRTILTAMGILIGIGAIVALGSIAEGIDTMVQSGLELTAGKITIMEKDAGFFGIMGELTDEDLEVVEGVGGIKDIVPILFYMESMAMMQGPEWVAIGIDPTKGEYFIGENAEMEDGRMIEEGESGVVALGNSIAERYNVEVGDFWTIKDDDFEIVGVIEKTDITDIDTSIMVNFDDLMDVTDSDTYQMIYVIPDDVKDTERIAEEIEDASERLDAMTTKEMARQASEIVDQIRIFTFAIGAIAALVGGLGVMNTMIMAVMERRREIGVMKAIGATNGMVLRQILTESALISLLGGAGGVMLGVIGSFFVSSIFGGGQITAVVTPGLALTGLSFALFLGLVGGLYPARKAAKLDPVVALRYE